MGRELLFDSEPVPGIAGLAGLTAPARDSGVTGVIDAIVLGAKSDGKTQFIAHAIRTLDARTPEGISPDETLANAKILEVVLNAKRPQPEANPDRRVRHYVFRVDGRHLLAGLGTLGRLGLALRGAAPAGWILAALAAAPVVFAATALLRGQIDAASIIAGALAAGLGVLWALASGVRELGRGGDLEIVFWDVAGEDVYSDRGAGPYHSLLQALVAARRGRGRARHTLAPILVCNPLAVGVRVDDSPYARLRMIMPTFAALGPAGTDVLAVVNRWNLAQALAGDGDGEELLAVAPVARAETRDGAEGPAAPGEPLPVVKRLAVQRHCLDGEPARMGATSFRLLRYEAGLDTQVTVRAWPGWDEVPAEVRARFAPPAETPATLVEYRYAEGPGVLAGDAALRFHRFLADQLWLRGQKPEPAAASVLTSSPTAETVVLPPPAEAVEERPSAFRSGT